ncbi:hypothetical protein L195_g033128 [Trifolium pratense]|uniref:Uncharacterized protein n=1 Tax=Trifolium pratense TaxID=57577 RepID=A0A2K3LF50_TRIPR|nr:hypothetical protein L195_g033128 [Trifolium pratense]
MPHSSKVRPVGMFEAVQEIAIYIHRFHNLDLFSQGWYQIKVTMRWEDSENISFGIPARVVQYEESQWNEMGGTEVFYISKSQLSIPGNGA